MFIGVAGMAGSGKDSFVNALINELGTIGIKAKRYSLGDNLKKEIAPIILKEKGFDPLDCSREQKELIRPMLVNYAKQKRNATKGRYWIEKLESAIKEDSEKPDIYCISDIRYAEFDKDEFHWLKNEKNGVLVHISKFFKEDGRVVPQKPPNEEEAKNDPILNEKADYRIFWEHGDKYIHKYPVQFIDWAIRANRLSRL